MYLRAEAVTPDGSVVEKHEWLFAPFYGMRPDDKKFLEDDKKLPDAKAATQADSQGPHEPIIRAGEERILTWAPDLKPGSYVLRAQLIYDLNRYNDPAFTDDQTTINQSSLPFKVGAGSR